MRKAYIIALSFVVLSSGCVATEKQASLMQPVPQPMAYQDPPPSYRNPGSIFDDTNAQMLFADSRARRVGDIVVVNVVESSTGTSTASTDTQRDNDNEMTVSSLFGRTKMPLFGGVVGADPLFGTSSSAEFQGSGTTTRRNNVTASVAARVVEVKPDGLMQIEGYRETKVNNETQYLVVTGLIRSRDVSRDNSVMSTQIADAKIAYVGKGVISDRQKPGWLTRLMDNIWPF